MEPLTLEPYDENRNIIQITEGDLKDAPELCAKQGGEMIHVRGNSSRTRMREALKKLSLDGAPVAVVPFDKAIYSPFFEFLEATTKDKVEKIPSQGWPLFTKQGSYQYPTGEAAATPAGVKILCFKTNNPWDLPNKRSSWLSKVPKLQQAINFLDTLSTSYTSARKFLSKLEKAKTTATRKITPMLPHLFQSILRFVKDFADGSRWGRSTPSDERLFEDFVKDTAQVESTSHKTQHPLVAVRKQNQVFELPLDPEQSWMDHLQLDDKTYGLSKPLRLRALGDDSTAGDATIVTQANVNIYHKDDDLLTLYAVEPNIVKGKVITARYVLASASVFLASTVMPSPIDCYYKTNSPYKICRTYTVPSAPDTSEQEMALCAKALLNKGLELETPKCPVAPAPHFPIAYRTKCGENETNLAIISAQKPIRVSVICNGQEKTSKEISRFPAQIASDCEIQEIDGEIRRTLLHQTTKETMQHLGNFEFNTPAPPTTDDEEGKIIVKTTHIWYTLLTVGLVSIIVISITILIVRVKRKGCGIIGVPSPAIQSTNNPGPRTFEPRPLSRVGSFVSRAPSLRSLDSRRYNPNDLTF